MAAHENLDIGHATSRVRRRVRRYHRIMRAELNALLRGRPINAVNRDHIYELIELVDKRHGHLLEH